MARIRTTLTLSGESLRQIKHLALVEHRSISGMVERLIREALEQRSRSKRLATKVELPSFDMGRPLADLANRDRLFGVTSGRK